MDDNFFSRFYELQSQGVPKGEAWERFRIEHALKSWPEKWGDFLHVSLYGGINLSSDISIPELGIYVSSEMETGDFVFGAPFCYECQIKVSNRDIDGLMDAISRLEIFLNACNVAISWAGGSAAKGAGCPIHYYCQFLFDGASAGLDLNENLASASAFLSASDKYTKKQYSLLQRAAWWTRQARHDLLSGNANPSLFAIYSAYWNAFECLTDLVCEVRPQQRPTKSEKREKVKEFFDNLTEAPTPEDVQRCYREIVDPGFRARAQHALTEVFQAPHSKQYFEACFTAQPSAKRLYQIRNDIDHGNIVEFNLDTRFRVVNGLNKLQSIVFGMFYFLIRPDTVPQVE